MVFRAAGEQHMDFRVHNTSWKPVDHDGLKLIMRPNPATGVSEDEQILAEGFSKASRMRKVRQFQQAAQKKEVSSSYTVIDLETTGLNYSRDEIIELGALRVRDGVPVEEFSSLVFTEKEIPAQVHALTGLAQSSLVGALSLKRALEKLLVFIGDDRLVCWNAAFDIAFLQVGCNRCGLPIPRNKVEDAQKLARKTVKEITDDRLVSTAGHLGIHSETIHRALPDCYTTQAVYAKLMEISPGNHGIV